MFGNLGEMAGLLKKAKEFQSNIQNVKAEMAQAEYFGKDPSGKISVVVSGDFSVKSINISPECTGNIQDLQINLLAAVNEAIGSAKNAAAEKMKAMTGGISIPGLF
jgi:DNA-binding YbaB/EbfC family protein